MHLYFMCFQIYQQYCRAYRGKVILTHIITTATYIVILNIIKIQHGQYMKECIQISLFLLFFSDAAGFFVKHIQTGMCIIDTNIIPAKGVWGSISFLELSNNSLDPAAQFRFRDSGAMLNLNRAGCLHPHNKYSGYWLDMFYLFANERALDGDACIRPIKQTSWGGLSVYYKGYKKQSFENWCAIPKTYEPLAASHGIDPYIGLTTNCTDTEDKRFNFGRFFNFIDLFAS